MIQTAFLSSHLGSRAGEALGGAAVEEGGEDEQRRDAEAHGVFVLDLHRPAVLNFDSILLPL